MQGATRRAGGDDGRLRRPPDGDRVLAAGEWALARAGLGLTWDAVEIAREAGTGDATGVRAFDVLRPGQQVASWPWSAPPCPTHGSRPRP